MQFKVYILQSEASGEYYVGSTSSLEKRIAYHNGGLSKYTRGKGPWRLVCCESFDAKSEALKREIYIKRMKSRMYVKKLIRDSAPMQ